MARAVTQRKPVMLQRWNSAESVCKRRTFLTGVTLVIWNFAGTRVARTSGHGFISVWKPWWTARCLTSWPPSCACNLLGTREVLYSGPDGAKGTVVSRTTIEGTQLSWHNT